MLFSDERITLESDTKSETEELIDFFTHETIA